MDTDKDFFDLDRNSTGFMQLANAIAERFGYSAGMAELAYNAIFNPNSNEATRTNAMKFIFNFVAEASKLYGEQDKIKAMEKPQIEARLLRLLNKHKSVPTPGVDVSSAFAEVVG